MTRSTVSILIGVLCLAAAVWCYFNFERVTDRQFVGFTGEAARNPLLAFQRLARRMGLRAQVMTKAAELDRPPPASTLLLAGKRVAMNPNRLKALVQWVSEGGHLIVEAEALGARDPLLDALRVSRSAVPSRKPADPLEVRFPDGRAPLRVALPPMELSYDGGRPMYSVRAGPGTALLNLKYGAGQVSALPSFEFMRNEHIGEHDHAAFAWALVQLVPDTSAVLIAPRFERPSLLAWLARDARGPLGAAAALMVLWLWRISRRFGPVQPSAEPRRRRLLEHLRASGRFLWASGSAPRLLAAAREACLARIARSRPGLVDLPRAERSARFAELTQIAKEDVELALDGPAPTQRAFTAAVSTLQQIEEKLARASRDHRE